MIKINLDKNKKYLLACSYGPDSMCLFDLLFKGQYHFSVAHVNYHFRSESNFEEQSLREYCQKHYIELFVLDNKEKVTNNIEERAREIRYSFFEKIVKEKGFDFVLTAHQLDDHLETYLLQKQRKNHVNYYGIKEQILIKNVHVIRPMLEYSKDQIMDYIKDNDVPYSIDQTNNEVMFERNKIRNNVLSHYSEEEKRQLLNQISQENHRISLINDKVAKTNNDLASINALSDEEFAYYLFERVHGLNENIETTYKFSREIKKIINSDKPNVKVHLKNIVVVKEYDKLLIYLDDNFDGYAFVIDKPCEYETDFFYLNFTNGAENRNVAIEDYPLTIRTYQKGDKYRIKDYDVEVRRLFIDWKMPVDLRKRWPLIVNKEGRIIYIPRYQKNFVKNNNCNFYVKSILL